MDYATILVYSGHFAEKSFISVDQKRLGLVKHFNTMELWPQKLELQVSTGKVFTVLKEAFWVQ